MALRRLASLALLGLLLIGATPAQASGSFASNFGAGSPATPQPYWTGWVARNISIWSLTPP